MNTRWSVLRPTSIDGCDFTKEVRLAARGVWTCSECECVLPTVRAVNAAVDGRPSGRYLDAVMPAGVLAVRDIVLDALPPEKVEEAVYIGRLTKPDGREIKGWATIVGKQKVELRGTKEFGWRECPTCTRLHYSARGKLYLCPPPTTDAWLLEAERGGLLIAERAVELMVAAGMRPGVFERVMELEEPLDGLPREIKVWGNGPLPPSPVSEWPS